MNTAVLMGYPFIGLSLLIDGWFGWVLYIIGAILVIAGDKIFPGDE